MSSKPASSSGSIFEFCLESESDHQIVDGGHDFSRIAHGHSSGIFMEGHVAAAVQSGFNAPVGTADLKRRAGVVFVRAKLVMPSSTSFEVR